MIRHPIDFDSLPASEDNRFPMTLVVSVRVPDGVVVGADSLATLSVQGQAVASGKVTCPHCNEEHDANLPFSLPPGAGTLSTLPYALKLIPLFGKYAVAAYGQSMMGERSIFSVIAEFQREHIKLADDLDGVIEALPKWLHEQLGKIIDTASIPDDKLVFGLQVSAFKDGKPTTKVIKIGKKADTEHYVGFGAAVNGQITVCTQLWALGQGQPQMTQAYQAWSVLDAAEYVKFLISTTADAQRFAQMVPNVGGDIDIALVTPENEFRWIQKKPLADLLLQEEHSHDAN